ncbi:hypothetical protein GOODEAATRI_026281, partial [Goodea atripinnis]
LFCFRQTLSESSIQSSTNHGVNQAESLGYSSPLQDFTATYAEINHQTKRKKKGKQSPAVPDGSVYSEIRT